MPRFKGLFPGGGFSPGGMTMAGASATAGAAATPGNREESTGGDAISAALEDTGADDAASTFGEAIYGSTGEEGGTR